MPTMKSMLIQFLFLFVTLCTLVSAQSMGPSSILRRRDPLPTDPADLSRILSQPRRSRSRQKIVGRGHDADALPLTNAQRMQLGLPFKPPRSQLGKRDQADPERILLQGQT